MGIEGFVPDLIHFFAAHSSILQISSKTTKIALMNHSLHIRKYQSRLRMPGNFAITVVIIVVSQIRMSPTLNYAGGVMLYCSGGLRRIIQGTGVEYDGRLLMYATRCTLMEETLIFMWRDSDSCSVLTQSTSLFTIHFPLLSFFSFQLMFKLIQFNEVKFKWDYERVEFPLNWIFSHKMKYFAMLSLVLYTYIKNRVW